MYKLIVYEVLQGSIIHGRGNKNTKLMSIYMLSNEKIEEMKHANMLHASYHYCCEKDFPL